MCAILRDTRSSSTYLIHTVKALIDHAVGF